MPRCSGNTEEHCCWIDGVECIYLETDTIPDRHWVCGLRRELGSWNAVHQDERYLINIKSKLSPHLGDCGNWPPDGVVCHACGVGEING